MKQIRMLGWIKNGDYQRTFKYPHAAFHAGWAYLCVSLHRNLYNGLKTVTQTEVRV
jgi:hypothetical protein